MTLLNSAATILTFRSFKIMNKVTVENLNLKMQKIQNKTNHLLIFV